MMEARSTGATRKRADNGRTLAPLRPATAGGAEDWLRWRMRGQLEALGFGDGWAAGAVDMLKMLQCDSGNGETVLSRLTTNAEGARALLGVRARTSITAYARVGRLVEACRALHPGTTWVTDRLFYQADVEFVRLQLLVKPATRLGPVAWEPPTAGEVRAWVERHGGNEAVLALLQGEVLA